VLPAVEESDLREPGAPYIYEDDTAEIFLKVEKEEK